MTTRNFNPRLREGGDEERGAAMINMNISIHASAKEATLLTIFFKRIYLYFNPRLREGGDRALKALLKKLHISIHASAKEATWSAVRHKSFLQISIHASAKEATNHKLRRLIRNWISIHASAKEATIFFVFKFALYKFQSTPPRRRRLQLLIFLTLDT